MNEWKIEMKQMNVEMRGGSADSFVRFYKFSVMFDFYCTLHPLKSLKTKNGFINLLSWTV